MVLYNLVYSPILFAQLLILIISVNWDPISLSTCIFICIVICARVLYFHAEFTSRVVVSGAVDGVVDLLLILIPNTHSARSHFTPRQKPHTPTNPIEVWFNSF